MRTFAVVLALWAVACAEEDAPAPLTPAPPPTPPVAPAELVAPTPPVAPTSSAPPVLKGIQAGDAACYLELTQPGGETLTVMADFELCPGGSQDATARIGQPVQLEQRKERVMAASCQGNPECPDTEEVDLVTALH